MSLTQDAGAADPASLTCPTQNPLSLDVLIDLALDLELRENWTEALDRWRAVRADFPEIPIIWAHEAATLLILGRPDDADLMIQEAVGRFPDSIDVASQSCNIALSRQDWIAASDRWLEIEQRFPDHGYVDRERDRLKRRIGGGLLQMGHDRIVQDLSSSRSMRNCEQSISLWRLMHETEPGDVAVLCRFGEALSGGGRLDEADSLLTKAVHDFPASLEIQAHHAQVAVARKDWGEATQRWQRLLGRNGEVPAFWVLGAATYAEAGLFDAAEELLRKAIEHEPERLELRIRHARLAEKRDHWGVAVSRWDQVVRLNPNDILARNLRGDALWQEAAMRLEKGEPAPDHRPLDQIGEGIIEDHGAAELKRIALCFEGLGDSCEFGIVQRSLGAEPIGLFRFAAVSAETLTSLAADKFERLGDPRYLSLSLTDGGEYLVRDTRGLYHMHSFVQKGSVDEAEFLEKQVKRLSFLKRKLMEDLASAEKVFVYRSSLGAIDRKTIHAMHAAFSRFGPVTLLTVRQAEAGHAAGSVEVVDERILIGYVEAATTCGANEIDCRSWQLVLRLAHRHKCAVDEGLFIG